MSHTLLSLEFTDADLVAIDDALAALEKKFAPLLRLSPEERLALSKMGEKSDEIYRQALVAAALNPGIIPASLALDEADADLAGIDKLRLRIHRLRELLDKVDDIETASGG
jgi:hypothetical protein